MLFNPPPVLKAGDLVSSFCICVWVVHPLYLGFLMHFIKKAVMSFAVSNNKSRSCLISSIHLACTKDLGSTC